mmetsp:Transcript_36947/g.82598  ORF Transcript_36947/g.82598 Transcript_36947/m.82598 type:complete len:87 (-) Transcript_36947:48-308(-)
MTAGSKLRTARSGQYFIVLSYIRRHRSWMRSDAAANIVLAFGCKGSPDDPTKQLPRYSSRLASGKVRRDPCHQRKLLLFLLLLTGS